MRLDGKTAVITGGNSGIGLATARRFVAEGARVLVTGRDETTLRTAVDGLGTAATALRIDLATPGAFDVLRTGAERDLGSVDVVFANAGIALPTPLGSTERPCWTPSTPSRQGRFPHRPDAAASRPVGRFDNPERLGRRSDGHAALRGVRREQGGDPRTVPHLRSRARTRKIRVNTVAPGPIRTPIWERSPSPAEIRRAAAGRIAKAAPAERFGTPEEVAAAVLFLASEDASYVYGAEIVVDGGMSGFPSGAPST